MKQIPQNITNAYLQTASEVLKRVHVDENVGLSEEDVTERLKLYGSNTIPNNEHFRVLKMFLKRFKDILILILLSAAGVSLFLGRVGDAIIICIAIGVDVGLSFLQVWRTERTLSKMRNKIKDTINVIRDGVVRTISSDDLVIGDIIKLRAGEKVPADARLIKSEGIRTKESMLTGESTDVDKTVHKLNSKAAVTNQSNIVFAGTTVINGSGLAVVTATGTRTEFGKIAQMLKSKSSPESPLRKQLQKQALNIGWLILAAVALISLIQLFKGKALPETLHTAITLVVSAIPEDLAMILTIILTIGVVRIFRKKGLVRELGAGETLGATTVICTDKTGTLTEGNMRATKLDFLQGHTILPNDASSKDPLQELALIGFILSSSAQKLPGDDGLKYFGSATERTSLSFVESCGYMQDKVRKLWRTQDSLPFNTQWKYRATLADHPTQATQTLFVTGAPDILLKKSVSYLNEHNETVPLTKTIHTQLQTKIDQLAEKGQRLITVAIKRHLHQKELVHDDIEGLTFLGVLAITDPVRPDVSRSIQETLSAGVQVKLITGDHRVTAKAIAKQVGISATPEQIMVGDDIHNLSDEALQKVIDDTTVFARVEPLDKQRIVRALQNNGHIVAMTGDGVNDTVALKSADIGVGMGSGSDIAKESSDLILLNNSFTTIISAIYEGRVIRDNIRKVLGFLLSTNAAEVAIFLASLIAGLPLPLLPAQILWINLVTDGTSDIALALEPAEDNVLKRPPEKPNESLLDKSMLIIQILIPGLLMTITTIAIYWHALQNLNLDLSYARTIAFTFLALTSLISTWSFRSLKQSIRKRGLWQNRWVPLSAVFSIGLHASSIYVPWLSTFFDTVPLTLSDWLYILTAALITVGIMDLRKMLLPMLKSTS